MVEDEVVNSVTVPVDMNLSIFQEIIEDRGAWHTAVHLVVTVGYNLVTEKQQNYGDQRFVARIRDS